jgi:hypothetical protein
VDVTIQQGRETTIVKAQAYPEAGESVEQEVLDGFSVF